MRVSSVSSVYYTNRNFNNIKNVKRSECVPEPCNVPNPAFKGKMGALLGGALAIGAIVATGGIAAPFISAAGLIGTSATLATGVIGGSAIEEKIKKNND